MKTLIKLSYAAAVTVAALNLSAEWIKVVDFDDYEVTTCEDCLIEEKGWIFQDWDFIGFPQCVDGTNDCTGLRAIIPAPFGGTGNAMEIRAGDPAQSLVANARSITVFPLPVEVPSGSVATFYMRFAVERNELAHHFGLVQNGAPTSDSAPTIVHNYGDLATSGQMSDTRPGIFAAHNGAWTAAHGADKMIEPGQWIELWYLIQNNGVALGGGLFDLYVRGGPFTELTHLVNPSLSQDLINAGVTQWPFRSISNEPLRRWINIANSGNPNVSFVGTGAVYIDDMWLNVGTMTTELPPLSGGESPTWAGYPVQEGGWVDTGDFMDLLNVESAPWVYSSALSGWIYLPEEHVGAEGAWAFVVR